MIFFFDIMLDFMDFSLSSIVVLFKIKWFLWTISQHYWILSLIFHKLVLCIFVVFLFIPNISSVKLKNLLKNCPSLNDEVRLFLYMCICFLWIILSNDIKLLEKICYFCEEVNSFLSDINAVTMNSFNLDLSIIKLNWKLLTHDWECTCYCMFLADIVYFGLFTLISSFLFIPNDIIIKTFFLFFLKRKISTIIIEIFSFVFI